jgi:predicted metal-dependent hydrolase
MDSTSARTNQNLFERGVDLFNRRAFFECHEVLEELWTPERGPRRLFLQGVIHLAVGFYHHQQGNRIGAERQLRKGLKKLAGYLPEFEGVNTALLSRESLACLDQIAQGGKIECFPKIKPQE